MMNERDESAVMLIGRLAGRLILTALAVLVIFIAARYAYDFGKDIFYQAPVEKEPGTDKVVELTDDMGTSELAELLVNKGLIVNGKAFAIQAQLYKTVIVDGTYTLNTSMTSKEILTAITEKALELKEEQKEEEESGEVSVVGGGDEEGEGNAKK